MFRNIIEYACIRYTIKFIFDAGIGPEKWFLKENI